MTATDTLDPFAPFRRTAQHRPFPIAPLLDRLRGASVIVAFNIAPDRAACWAEHGLTWADADRAAITLGMHPCEIWPEWWEHAHRDLPATPHQPEETDPTR